MGAGERAPAGTDSGVEATVAHVGLRAHEVRPRAAVPDLGRELRRPDGRAALLQRLRAAAGALEPVYRRARDLRGAPFERQAAARLRGQRAAARLRVRA